MYLINWVIIIVATQHMTCVFITLLFQIKEEFRRITTIHLELTFLTKLDFYTPKLQEILGTKGGVAGTKIRPLLDSLSQVKCKIHTITINQRMLGSYSLRKDNNNNNVMIWPA